MAVSTYRLKPRLQGLLDPMVRALPQGITANHLTAAGLAVSAAAGVAVLGITSFRAAVVAVPLFLGLRMILNAADGMLARLQGPTRRGAVLNEACDIAGDAIAYIPFLIVLPNLIMPLSLALLTSLIAEIIAVTGADTGRINSGPLAKSDRALLFSVLAVVHPLTTISSALAWLLPVLAAATVVNRWRQVG